MLTVRVIPVNGNGIVVVVLACVEVLWISVPARVEEHPVEDDVGEENSGSVLFARPPGAESIETLSVLVGYVGVGVLRVANGDGPLQLLVVGGPEGVFERDDDLRVHVAVDSEVNRLSQINRVAGSENDLVDGLQQSRFESRVLIGWIRVALANEEVSVTHL